MLNFNKLYDIRRILQNVVTDDQLIRAVFEDIPELEEISFSVTQEYDDNNNFDYVRPTAINGWNIDSEYVYEEDCVSDLPKIEVDARVGTIVDLIEVVGKDFGTGEDHKIDRAYAMRGLLSDISTETKTEMKYILNYLMGKKLPDNFFVSVDSKWALYHAHDHGRFKPETEFKIFARPGRMFVAMRYAREVLKGPLDEKIENFFILNAQPGSEDHRGLQSYIEEFKNITQTV